MTLKSVFDVVAGWFNPAGDTLLPAALSARHDELMAQLQKERRKGVMADRVKIRRLLSDLHEVDGRLKAVADAAQSSVTASDKAVSGVRDVLGIGLGAVIALGAGYVVLKELARRGK